MASWNAGTITDRRPVKYPGSPGWLLIDCGCCNGIQWGGDEPVECYDCKGGGSLALHIKTGALALYPGGPFAGKLDAEIVAGLTEGAEE